MTLEQIKQEVMKCTDIESGTGFLYFVENYVTVPHPSKGSVVLRDNIYSWQKKAAQEFVRNRMFIFLKKRQVSATTLTIIYFLWRCLFFENQQMVIVSLTQRDSADVLRRVKFIYDCLPVWLRTPKTEDAKTSITFENNSLIKALPFKEDVVRGQSPSAILIDEMAYMEPYIQNLLASAVPALGMGLKTEFSRKTLPSQLFLVSTLPLFDAGNNTYFKLLTNAMEKPEDSTYRVIDVDVSDIPEYNDPEWHKIQLESLGEHRYNVEVLAKINEFIDAPYIPTDTLKKMTYSTPIRMDFLRPQDVTQDGFSIRHESFHEAKEEYDESFNYMKGLWIYHDPVPGKEYGLAADVSAGVGGDASSFHVIDLETGEQVAEYDNNKINTELYKRIILAAATYYNESKICIENNSIADPLCKWFTETLQYQKFYWHRKSKKTYVPGLPVYSNRGNVLAALSNALTTDPPTIKVNSIRTLNQLKFFGYNANTGKLEGTNGSKDDLVLSLAQFAFVRDAGFFVTVKQSLNELDEGLLDRIERAEKSSKDNAWFKDMFDMTDERNLILLEYMKEDGLTVARPNGRLN